jgi:hypothetical protein
VCWPEWEPGHENPSMFGGLPCGHSLGLDVEVIGRYCM